MLDIMPHDSQLVTQLALIPARPAVFSPPTRRISRPDTDLILAAICPNEIPKSRAPAGNHLFAGLTAQVVAN